MKWRFAALGPVVLAFCVLAVPLYAQTSDTTTKPVGHHQWYDMTQEIRLAGTVSSVEKAPARGTGTLPGSFLVVETSGGRVNASLGRYALRGKSPVSVSAGQQVQMIGIMKTIRDQQVFVARVLQVNGHAYTLRNQHGFASAALAHNRTPKSEAKGGQL